MVGVIILVLISMSINEKQKLILEQDKLLFKVKNKLSGKAFVVYSIKSEDNELTEFLIYENNQWQWVLSDMYIPYSISE